MKDSLQEAEQDTRERKQNKNQQRIGDEKEGMRENRDKDFEETDKLLRI